MAAITKYRSDIDGIEFDTEAEQRAHDAGLKHRTLIDGFLDRHFPKAEQGHKQGPSRSIACRALMLWLGEQHF